jgi:hypothetical protein
LFSGLDAQAMKASGKQVSTRLLKLAEQIAEYLANDIKYPFDELPAAGAMKATFQGSMVCKKSMLHASIKSIAKPYS